MIFYNSNWTELDSVGHKFNTMAALEYDSIGDSMYFNDLIFGNGSILSFRVSEGLEFPRIEPALKQLNASIRSIVYDPYEKMLYWNDFLEGAIFRSQIGIDKKPELFIQFVDKRPLGLAINVCER